MTEEVLEQQPSIKLGVQLSNAREQFNVSVDEMAHKLKLTAKQIEALEGEDYSQLGPVTFVKGYIRSYCREFSLNEADLMTLFSHQREEAEKRMQSFSRRTEREAKDNRLMLFSYAIIALIIGSSLFIWWQNRDVAPIASEKQTVAQTSDNEEIEAVKSDRLPIQQADTLEPLKLAANDVEISNTQVDKSLEQIEAQPVTKTVENKSVPTKRATNVDTITMTFKDDSWVEIFDADGERVAFGVKKKGYVMTLEGKAPFNVVLGKHYIVDVKFNGDLIDISHFPTNRLAKFSLPLSE
ncbi:RodZ domain-containing protein [Pseudoalteromonas sp. SSM20]|uniref:RodZ domain-containing protein n=1 Tax=Pseudoalteromonas sp. SSM20 TaxID=3139394 RepID=UPI003BAB64A5